MSDSPKEMPLRLARGTSQQHRQFTGPSGSVTVNTDTGNLHVHDGETKGGKEVVSFPEAPSDDTPFVRKNGEWLALDHVNFDGGSIAEGMEEEGQVYFTISGSTYRSALEDLDVVEELNEGNSVVRGQLPNGDLLAIPATDGSNVLEVLDAQGAVVKTITHNLGFSVSQLDTDADGNIYYGYRDGSGSVNVPRIAKMDRDGQILWDQDLPRGTSTSASYTVRSLCTTRDGKVLATVLDNVSFAAGTSSNKAFILNGDTGAVEHENQFLNEDNSVPYVDIVSTRTGKHFVGLSRTGSSSMGALVAVGQTLNQLSRIDFDDRLIGLKVSSDDHLICSVAGVAEVVKVDQNLKVKWTFKETSGDAWGFNGVTTSDLYVFLANDWPNQIVKLSLDTGHEVGRVANSGYVQDHMFTSVAKWDVWSN
jgi:hypothetical protein